MSKMSIPWCQKGSALQTPPKHPRTKSEAVFKGRRSHLKELPVAKVGQFAQHNK